MLTSYGGKIIKTVPITEPGVKGEYMEMIAIDLYKFTFDTLSRFYEDRTPEEQAEDEAIFK